MSATASREQLLAFIKKQAKQIKELESVVNSAPGGDTAAGGSAACGRSEADNQLIEELKDQVSAWEAQASDAYAEVHRLKDLQDQGGGSVETLTQQLAELQASKERVLDQCARDIAEQQAAFTGAQKQIDKLTLQLSAAEEERDDTRQQISALKSIVLAAEDKCSSVTNEMEEWKLKAESSLADNVALKASLETAELALESATQVAAAELEAVSIRALTAEEEIKSLVEQLKAVEEARVDPLELKAALERAEMAESALNSLPSQSEFEDVLARAVAAEKELSVLKDSAALELSSELESANNRAALLEGQVSELAHKLEEVEIRLQSTLEKVESLSTEHSIALANNDKAREAASEKFDLEQQRLIADHSNEILRLRSEIEESLVHNDEELSVLRHQLDQLSAEKNELVDKLESQHQQLQAVPVAIDDSAAPDASLELDLALSNLAAAEAECISLQEQLSAANAKLESFSTSSSSELETALTSATTAEKETEHLREQLQDLKSNLESLSESKAPVDTQATSAVVPAADEELIGSRIAGVSDLSGELEVAIARAVKAEEEASHLQQQLKVMEANLESSLVASRAELDAAGTKVVQLEEQLEAAPTLTQLDSVKGDLARSSVELEASVTRAAVIEEELQQWKDKVETLESALSEAPQQSEFDALTEIVAAKEQELESLNHKLEELETAHAALVTELQAALVERDENVLSLTTRLESMTSALEVAENMVLELKESSTSQAIAAEKEVMHLQELLNAARAAQEGALDPSELESALNRLSVSESAVVEWKSKVEAASLELSQSHALNDELQTAITAAESKVESLRSQFEGDLEAKSQDLGGQIDALQIRSEKAEVALLEAQQQAVKLAEEHAHVVGELQERVDGAESMLAETLQSTDLADAISRAVAAEEELKVAKAQAECDLAALQSQLEQQRTERESAESFCVTAGEKLHQLMEKYKELEKQFSVSEIEKNAALAKQHTDMQSAADVMSELTVAREEVEMGKSQLRNVQAELEQAKIASAALETKIEDLERTSTSQINTLSESLAISRAETDALRGALEETAGEVLPLEEKAKALAAEVEQLKSEAAEGEAKLRRLKVLLNKSQKASQSRESELEKLRAAPPPPTAFAVVARIQVDGEEWCCIQPIQHNTNEDNISTVADSSIGNEGVGGATSTLASADSSNNLVKEKVAVNSGSVQWEKRALVDQWIADGVTSATGVNEWPPLPQNLVEAAEANAAIAVRQAQESMLALQAQLDAVQDDFGKYKLRAHTALKKATSTGQEERSRQMALEEAEAAVAQERESSARRENELNQKLDGLQQRIERELIEKEELKYATALATDAHKKALAAEINRTRDAVDRAIIAEDELSELREIWTALKASSEQQATAIKELTAKFEEQVTLTAQWQTEAKKREDAMATATLVPSTTNASVFYAGSPSVRGLRHQRTHSSASSFSMSDGPPPGSGLEGVGAGGAPLLADVEQREQWQASQKRGSVSLVQLESELQEALGRVDLMRMQEAALKKALREAEEELERERSFHSGVNAEVNVEYLKKCIHRFMSTSDCSEKRRLLGVIATLLRLKPDEIGKCEERIAEQEQGVIGSTVGSVWSFVRRTSQLEMLEDTSDSEGDT